MTTKNLLLIPHLRVHNANALSSPYSIGFPAMTAWLGAVHALQRHLKQGERYDDLYEELRFLSVGVACHHLDLQTYQEERAFVASIVGTGNPLDKSGNRPSFIEEARCHLDVSLLIEYDCEEDEDLTFDLQTLLHSKLKIAGGDILSCGEIEKIQIDDEASQRRLLGKLMPSYCLVERKDLMQQAMQDGQDAMDALLDALAIHHSCELVTENAQQTVKWQQTRRHKGWIVPIAVGFQGISELGHAEQQRDASTLHRFAESIVTLGEFIMPYRLESLDNLLWHYHTDLKNHLYICQQNKPLHHLEESAHG